jgi:hypothetical protein
MEIILVKPKFQYPSDFERDENPYYVFNIAGDIIWTEPFEAVHGSEGQRHT